MKQAPFITGDGSLVDVGEVHFNTALSAPQVAGVMRFTHTSDAMRGLVRDVCDRAMSEGRPLSSYLDVSGRSGHSRIGIDVELDEALPFISDSTKTIDVPIKVTVLNKDLAESLADLRAMTQGMRVDIGRLFIPLSPSLSRDEVLEALDRNQLLLPERYEIDGDGSIELPLQDIRYTLSSRLSDVRHNFVEMIITGKHGLSLFQCVSPSGMPEFIRPKQFLVSAVHISLGPFSAFIERPLSDPNVFHLASRLLDGVRTTGISTPRHVEIYNKGEEAVPARDLRVRLRLYPADERVAEIADRILQGDKAKRVIARGVDFPDLTDIFNPDVYQPLMDEITPSPGDGGQYGRILMPETVINIPWEQEGDHWLPEFQWRLVYEYARGNMREAVLTGDEIPKRLRSFITDLRYVGGEQKLSKVFVADSLPPVDTLRVLKRNGIGVIICRGVACISGAQCPQSVFRLDQAAYEELANLEREGMRFYIVFQKNGDKHIREFYKGLWVTGEGRGRLDNVHTCLAMYGSTMDSLKDVLKEPIRDFFTRLKANPDLGESLAVVHGSGPGVMKVVDEIAKDLGIFRLGVGIDAEEVGQTPNYEPEAMVQFVNLALNTRQDIMDRRSLFKVFNVGGFGTCYEINMALTFMKIAQCLPAPYIFVDPFGFGVEGGPLWGGIIGQFETLISDHEARGVRVGPLGPGWLSRCCHVVDSYARGLKIIEDFIRDPAGYWRESGIPLDHVLAAHRNLLAAGVPMPPFIEAALGGVREEAAGN